MTITQYVVADNVSTTLATAASSTATTFTLASAANLPTLSAGQAMPLTMNDAATGLIYEVVYVTAISGVTLTVVRAQEGTGAQNWNIGDYAFCAPTSGTVATSLGNPSNTFLVAPATASAHAMQLQQATSTTSPLALATTAATLANQAVNLGQFASSFGANGYQTLPGGLILQWGVGASTGATAGNFTATYPLAFPTSFLGGSMTVGGSTASNYTVQITSSTKTVITGTTELNGAYSSGINVYWFAIGH